VGFPVALRTSVEVQRSPQKDFRRQRLVLVVRWSEIRLQVEVRESVEPGGAS
jgi:hypothetical protein